jgi:predicted RND superfamily exporter protein
MLRCLSCNGILSKNEGVCYTCGEAVPENVKHKGKGGGFATVVNIAFFSSLAFIGLSIFTNFGPPLTLSVAMALILLFVRSSADQLRKNRN